MITIRRINGTSRVFNPTDYRPVHTVDAIGNTSTIIHKSSLILQQLCRHEGEMGLTGFAVNSMHVTLIIAKKHSRIRAILGATINNQLWL